MLTKLLYHSSYGKNSREMAQELKWLTSVSVGIPSDIFTFKVQLLVHQIEFLSRQIQAIEDKIESFDSHQESPIYTNPGNNTILAAYILSSMQNKTLFDIFDSFLALTVFTKLWLAKVSSIKLCVLVHMFSFVHRLLSSILANKPFFS